MIATAWDNVRARWVLFVGSLIALVLGVAVIATTGEVLVAAASGAVPTVGVGRYDATPVLVRADQTVRVPVPGGSGRAVDQWPAREQRLVPVSAARSVRAVPGVGRVVVDRSLPARLVAVGGKAVTGTDGTPTGHGWSSTALTPFVLTAGRAPRTDQEVVLGADLATATGARPGDRGDVVTPAGLSRVQVVGIAAPPGATGVPGEQAIFFTDAAAARLSGDAGHADAIGVFGDGAPATLAARVRAALPDPSLRVSTGPDKGGHPAASSSASALVAVVSLLSVMAAITGFVCVFVLAGTFAFAIAQRRRELALLRAIGATPRQVRTMIFGEALALGVFGSALGCAVGSVGGPLLASELVRLGIAPAGFIAARNGVVLLGAAGVGLAVALLGVVAAARRASRVRPVEALLEADLGRYPMTAGRWIVGVLFLGGAAVLIGNAPSWGGGGAVTVAVLLPEIVVVGLVALAPLAVPFLVRLACALLRTLPSASVSMALANARSAPRRTTSTAAPVLVTVAVAGSLLGVLGTTAATATATERAGLTADFVVSGGLPPSAVPRLAAGPGVRAVVPVVTTHGWLIGSDYAAPETIGAVTVANVGTAVRFDVVAGSLRGLVGNTVLVDRDTASTLGWRVGQAVTAYLGDGAATRLTVVAVVRDTASLPPVLVPPAVVAGHVRDTMADPVYVSASAGTARAALAGIAAGYGANVVSADDWLTQRDAAAQRQNMTLALVLVGLALLYSGIAIANTLVMGFAERAAEVGLLRRIGASRTQILRTIAHETVLVVGIGVLLGALAAGVGVAGVRAALADVTGSVTVSLPWGQFALVIAACLGAALLAGLLPAWRALRTEAADRATAQ